MKPNPRSPLSAARSLSSVSSLAATTITQGSLGLLLVLGWCSPVIALRANTESHATPAHPAPEAPTKVGSATVPALGTKGMTVPQALRQFRQSRQRWLQVDLSNQRLIAWEGGEQAYAVVISAGTEQDPTLPGVFAIQSKHESTRMRGPGYDVSNVPFAMYYDGNYAIHGAYWHQQFGTPVSRGCVNVAVDHAEWFFTWASVGTPVVVHY